MCWEVQLHALLATLLPVVAAHVPPSVNVIRNGMLGFPTYRGGKVLQLPLHNGSSHSPPLIVTGCGRRPGGGDAGCRSVVMRRSFDGGKSFDEPRVVANASHLVWDGTIPDGIYDGAFVHDSRTNTTLMHWGMCIEQCRPGRNQSVWRAPSYMQTRSTDGFVTWTTRNLTAEVGEAANHLYPDNYYGNGLQLHDGTLVLCGSQMDFDNPAPEQKPGATDGGFCVRSTDGGRSFARGETFAHDWPPCKSTGCAKMQMQVGQFANGTLLVMGGAGQPSEHDTFAISTDGGVTFSSPHSDPRLPTSTESDLLVVTKKGGDAIFVSHDFCPGCSPLPDGHNRRNLTISASYNHGVTWHHVPLLPEDGREDFSGGSCMADMSVGGYDSIAVGYERGSKRFDGNGIWFVAVSYKSLLLPRKAVVSATVPSAGTAVPVPAPAPFSRLALWSAQQLQQRVISAVLSSRTVNVPGGDYIFENASLLISDASQGFALRAADPDSPVRLWFDIGWGLVVQNSADVVIDGPIELDYTSGAHYQGTIVGPVEPASTVLDISHGADGTPAGACYRRSHTIVAHCEHVSTHDTWMHLANGSWVYYAHTNCFSGHGADNILPEPYSNHLGLQDCQAACDKDSDCDAIVVPAQQGTDGRQGGMNVTVQTDPGFLDPDVFCARYCHWSESEHEIGAMLWQKSTQKFMRGAKLTQLQSTASGEFLFHVSAGSQVEAGDKVYIGIRGGLTLHTHNSSRSHYTNITVHGAPFMAVTEFDGQGGHIYEGLAVQVRNVAADPLAMCGGGKRLCQGILASNADCFHSSGCKHGPRLRNVVLSSTLDDYLNIHTRTQLLAQLPPQSQTGHLTILDPRLKRDKGLPNDAPYGTVETFQNVQPGDTLEFFALNSLLPLASRPVISTRRLTNHSLAIGLAAQANIDLPKLNRGFGILPIDVCGLGGEPSCALRAWDVVLGGAPLPANVVRYSLVHISGWDASGAVLENNCYYDGYDGIRWKSSNGVISGSDFRDVKYLEVTPLQHYFEGTLQISNVTIQDNELEPSKLTFCKGTGGKGEFWKGACINMTARNNTCDSVDVDI